MTEDPKSGFAGIKPLPTALWDDEGKFVGHEADMIEEHYSTKYRAWCKCGEWCYPDMPCGCCLRTVLKAKLREISGCHQSIQYFGATQQVCVVCGSPWPCGTIQDLHEIEDLL